jgi:hypothetical protein
LFHFYFLFFIFYFLFASVEDSEALPKVLDGKVEATSTDPVPDNAGAQLREWIMDARPDPVVSAALQRLLSQRVY